MDMQQRRSVTHRMVFARQVSPPNPVDPVPGSGNSGNGGNNGNAGGGSSSTSSTSSTNSSSTSSTSTQQPPTSTKQTTTSTRPSSTRQSATTSASNTITTSTSSAASTTTTGTSTTSSGILNTGLRATTQAINNNLLPTSSFNTVSPTDVDSAGTTVTADAVPTDNGGSKAGPIIGGVVGTIAALAIIGFIISFLLRRFNRRRARPVSDFGTFRRTSFVKDKPSPNDGSFDEKALEPSQPGHSVAPSLGNAAAVSAAAHNNDNDIEETPVRQRGGLQERPKYVYGQDPAPGSGQSSTPDDTDHIDGVYSSDPQMQTAYNAEAYGSYAKYEDVGVAHGGYQDAQREYQGQQGAYDAQTYAAYQQYSGYDQQQYAGYDQQYAGYDQTGAYQQYQQGYDQQQGAYDAQQQSQYQHPHPYSSAAGATSAKAHGDAYGGM